MRGTANFVSLRSHEGEDISRRDDLECLVYSFIYLNNKFSLPWVFDEENNNTKNVKDLHNRIYESKKIFSQKDIHGVQSLNLFKLLTYVRKIESFETEPNYEEIKNLLS